MKSIQTLIIAALLIVLAHATARAFETTVSTAFTVSNAVVLNLTNSSMDTAWFVGRAGGRTIYSDDVVVGAITRGTGNIAAHATWVINYTPSTRTVNINAGRTHITNWWGTQRCNVYEDGTCNCGNNPTWNVCAYPPLAPYATAMVAMARIARLNAKLALEAAGYTVTNN